MELSNSSVDRTKIGNLCYFLTNLYISKTANFKISGNKPCTFTLFMAQEKAVTSLDVALGNPRFLAVWYDSVQDCWIVYWNISFMTQKIQAEK